MRAALAATSDGCLLHCVVERRFAKLVRLLSDGVSCSRTALGRYRDSPGRPAYPQSSRVQRASEFEAGRFAPT